MLNAVQRPISFSVFVSVVCEFLHVTYSGDPDFKLRVGEGGLRGCLPCQLFSVLFFFLPKRGDQFTSDLKRDIPVT